MGLIKAAVSAVTSTLHDQWKDIITCENMDNDTLMVRKTTDTGVITKKSIIRVMPGQCAVIIQNGKALDATAEEGDYNFDESTEPSFFAGDFGNVFKQMWQRFTFGGGATGQQAVFYFNTKEIIDNKFGTAQAIPFKDWTCQIPNQMTGGVQPLPVNISCYGTYTFKITDPALFLREIAGTANIYKKDTLTEQIRGEVLAALQNLLNEMGRVRKTPEEAIGAYDLPSQTDELKAMMEENVYDEPIRQRGLTIKAFNIVSVTPDEESKKKIDQYNLSANAHMQQGTLVGSYADAVKDAANNSNGAANGFMGIGMMNMAGGGAFGAAVQNAQINSQNNTVAQQTEAPAQQEQPSVTKWVCSCGQENKGKFCLKCGKPKPEGRKCPNCGEKLTDDAMFCPECGEKV